jgi:hypothetical protein
MRRQRHENYRAAVAMWRRLESDGFRQRLELLTAEAGTGVVPESAEGVES